MTPKPNAKIPGTWVQRCPQCRQRIVIDPGVLAASLGIAPDPIVGCRDHD